MTAAVRLFLEAIAVGCYAASLVLAAGDASSAGPVTRKVTRKPLRQDPLSAASDDLIMESGEPEREPPPESGVMLSACSPSQDVWPDDRASGANGVAAAPTDDSGTSSGEAPPGPSPSMVPGPDPGPRFDRLTAPPPRAGPGKSAAPLRVQFSGYPPTRRPASLPVTFGPLQESLARDARTGAGKPPLRDPHAAWGKFLIKGRSRTAKAWQCWAIDEREPMRQLELPQARAPDPIPAHPPGVRCGIHGRDPCRCPDWRLVRAREPVPVPGLARASPVLHPEARSAV